MLNSLLVEKETTGTVGVMKYELDRSTFMLYNDNVYTSNINDNVE
jgi:hypothetical protein